MTFLTIPCRWNTCMAHRSLNMASGAPKTLGPGILVASSPNINLSTNMVSAPSSVPPPPHRKYLPLPMQGTTCGNQKWSPPPVWVATNGPASICHHVHTSIRYTAKNWMQHSAGYVRITATALLLSQNSPRSNSDHLFFKISWGSILDRYTCIHAHQTPM